MDGITRDDVAHLAKLARLALADDELDELAGQIKDILQHVNVITAVSYTHLTLPTTF